MKFTFHVSPNIKDRFSTQRIMWELTGGLMVIFVISCIYYGTSHGMNYAMQAIILLASSLITTLVCEAIFALCTKKKPLDYIKTSFGWVTSIILTMMVPISMTPYALIIATACCIVLGKLLFGGFGNNIFNPAAVGRAIIFASFMGATTDLVTSATPTTVIASTYNWLPATSSVLDTFLEQFGGFMGLALGTYPGAIGETFSIAIILVGIYLAFRQVIDWRVPVTYLGGIFVLTAIVALLTGIESYHGIPGFIWYPVLHLLTGGVIFGGVFMLTDPVTSPTSAGGRVIFALGAAVLTVLIRLKANLPEGCLYSILLMNLFTPMIENALDGKQLEIKKKVWTGFICIAIVGLGVSFYAASSIEPVTKIESEATSMVVDNVPVEHVQEEVSL